MTREEFKIFAYGQFAQENIESTVNTKDMILYAKGAVLGYDMAKKLNPNYTEPVKFVPKMSHSEKSLAERL